jgi:ComF family protein
MTAGHHRPMGPLGRLTAGILDLALPPSCAGCGREGAALCPACLPALDARSGLPGGTPIGLPADIPMPLLQLELKYAGEQRLAVPLGAAVARRWSAVGVGTEVVVPVPVHADRERRRGYDQAALIAAVAADHLRLPAVRALERGRATLAQFELGRDERASNVAGAFRLRTSDPTAKVAIAGRWVLLVDDVVTTGATLAACGTALIAAGALAVSAIAVARER